MESEVTIQDWVLQRLKLHEGVSLIPFYNESGEQVIGIGRRLDFVPFTSDELRAVGDWPHGITLNAANMLLRNDVCRCFEQLYKHIKFFDELDKERQYALLDICFQLGIKRLLRFKKILMAMKQKDWLKAAFEFEHSKAAPTETPQRIRRIAVLIKTGKWRV